jgi:hypothetical protein
MLRLGRQQTKNTRLRLLDVSFSETPLAALSVHCLVMWRLNNILARSLARVARTGLDPSAYPTKALASGD